MFNKIFKIYQNRLETPGYMMSKMHDRDFGRRLMGY